MADILNPTGDITIYGADGANGVDVVVDGLINRLAELAKLQNSDGDIINPGTEESLQQIKTAIENGGSANYTTFIDTSNKDITYIGEAVPGTLGSESLWRIQKADTTDKNNSSVKFAVGADFTNKWTERLTLTYA